MAKKIERFPEIGQRIRSLREAKNLTQEQTADEIAATKTTYAAWEKGSPTLEAVLRLADYFGVSYDFLIAGKTAAEPRVDPKTASELSLLKWYRSCEADPQAQMEILDAAAMAAATAKGAKRVV